ncbi:hypothetical protein Nepgr_013949 [Nepenthes gracilis]|uniref:Uncharacterized protein n=1 Tax=Nepenthes gracilis TaxID=150966 RepID=A0AAD3SIP1_NEPGR|nr:hypothetical protein Nepgr_013949 [Nepenthes gracilis]
MERSIPELVIFHSSPRISGQEEWNGEETAGMQLEGSVYDSSSERSDYDDHRRGTGNEHDDVGANDCAGIYSCKSGDQLEGSNGNADDDDVDCDEVKDDDDNAAIDGAEYEQGDSDVDGCITGSRMMKCHLNQLIMAISIDDYGNYCEINA